MVSPDILEDQQELYDCFLKLDEIDPAAFADWTAEQLDQLQQAFHGFNEADHDQAAYHATHVFMGGDEPPNVMGYEGTVYSGNWTHNYAAGNYTKDGVNDPDDQYRNLGDYGSAIEAAAQEIMANDGDPEAQQAIKDDLVEHLDTTHAEIAAQIEQVITDIEHAMDGASLETDDPDVQVAQTLDYGSPTGMG